MFPHWPFLFFLGIAGSIVPDPAATSFLDASQKQIQSLRRQVHHIVKRTNPRSIHYDCVVTFITRAHRVFGQYLLTQIMQLSLMYGVEKNICVLVVPTQKDSIDYLTSLVKKFNSFYAGEKMLVIPIVLHFPVAAYENEKVLQSLCSLDFQSYAESRNHTSRNNYGVVDNREPYSYNDIQRICSVNCPLHYLLTDVAIKYVLRYIRQSQYLVITNADNYYLHSYLAIGIESLTTAWKNTTIAKDLKVNTFRRSALTTSLKDYEILPSIVLFDMISKSFYTSMQPKLNVFDLGCAIIRTDFLRKSNLTFLNALPNQGLPSHYHDADGWFIESAVAIGAYIDIIQSPLYIHN